MGGNCFSLPYHPGAAESTMGSGCRVQPCNFLVAERFETQLKKKTRLEPHYLKNVRERERRGVRRRFRLVVGRRLQFKEGLPVFAIGVGQSTFDKALVHYYVQSHIQINEYRDRVVLPNATKKYGRHIGTCVKVLDMTGLKLSALSQIKFEEYSKMVYLDADIQVLENIDHLFDAQDGYFYAVKDCFCEKTWSHTPQYEIGYCQQCPKKVRWPAEMGSPPALYFNAGMFVFEPSRITYESLLQTLRVSSPTPFAEQVHSYSEWVIDGEYDWPPKCCCCQAVLEDGNDSQTTRLGCLHVIHTKCFVSHIKSYPSHTAPAGYVCPTCSTSIWPPKSIKDSGSHLHSNLKEAIMQTGLEKNLFGNHPVSLPAAKSRGPPPAFASDPIVHASDGNREKNNAESVGPRKDLGLSSSVGQEGKSVAEGYSPANGIISDLAATEIVEINSPSSRDHGPNSIRNPIATTRKGAYHVERQNSEISYYGDDEDGTQKKYSRRGPFRNKFLKALLPFWSSSLPTLPVTAPSRNEMSNGDEGRLRHKKSSRMDPRKILLFMAIMACMATMGILYYRLVQRGLDESRPQDLQHLAFPQA